MSAPPPRGEVRAPKQERSQLTRLKLLDAAVDCLLDEGYVNLTTAKVAERAGVSRGAQQHHFPSKVTLVAQALDHLYQREDRTIIEQSGDMPAGPERVGWVLDLLWKSYSGKLYAASLELALAAEHDAELRSVVADLQREQNDDMVEWCGKLFAPAIPDDPAFVSRVQLALATMRGLAVLTVFRYPRRTVDEQWAFARTHLIALLLDGAEP